MKNEILAFAIEYGVTALFGFLGAMAFQFLSVFGVL